MELVLSIISKHNVKIQNIQCFKSISKLKKLQNHLLDQKLTFLNYRLSYAVSKQNLISFFQAAEMNTIANDIITYFNFFDFFKLSVDFEFKELENEIYTFIDQHHIKFPKKEFLNKDDLLQFYDTFTLDPCPSTENDYIPKQFTIPANILSIVLPLRYPFLESISVDSNNSVFKSIDGILYSKNLDQLICVPPKHSSSKYELFSSITNICNSAFLDCGNLKSILVESNNQHFCSIDGILFSKNLDRIICFPSKHRFSSYCIPASVTSIGDYAFYNCDNLQSIRIPTSVTSIGKSVFYWCSKLQSITVESTNLHFASIEGILFTKDLATIICFPPNHLFSTYNIPISVTSIGDGAFSGCSNLQSITIPTSVTSIGNSTFSHCSNLQSITIPTSVTSIGDYTFYFCSNLQSVAIPASVTSIGHSLFTCCKNLRSVSIPNIFRFLISEIFPEIRLSGISILPLDLRSCDAT